MSLNSKRNRDIRKAREAARQKARLARRREAFQSFSRRAATKGDFATVGTRIRAGLAALTRSLGPSTSFSRANRLARYADLLMEEPPPDQLDPKVNLRAAALVEGALVAEILDSVEAFAATADWRQHVRKLVGGDIFPGSRNDQARAKQFELWWAARCVRAGYTVALAEPDIVISDGDGTRFGLAAKRPRTRRALQDRIEEGVDQIHRAGLKGFLVLDATEVLELHNRALVVEEFETGGDELERLIADLSGRGEFARWVRAKDPARSVLGIVVSVFTAVISRKTAGIMGYQKVVGGPIWLMETTGRDFFDRITRLALPADVTVHRKRDADSSRTKR